MSTIDETDDIVLQVHCPADVYGLLRTGGMDKDSLGQQAREALALRLYGEHRLSLGKAAELAALPMVKFMDLLRSLQLPVVEYGDDEYRQDLLTLATLMSSQQKTQ